ncbi:MAG: ribosome maturation factor RimM [Clostridiales bacterium]|jgi:16S rRNA processing protein RimM|nr:ribosome maturation factor RimM [Clostridiales bacterium]
MRISIGYISKPHGLKGELKVLPETYDAAIFKKLKELYVDGKAYKAEYAKPANGYVIVKLGGIDNADAAGLFRNKTVEIDEKDRMKLPAGVHYISDLIGCGVYAGETRIGELADVLQNGAADVYVVKDGGKEIMFPALKDLLKKVDTENKLILLDEKRFNETAVYNDK